MTQQEFNRIVIYGTEEELQEAVQKYPKLMQTCAEQIEAELNSTMVPPISEQWYQRLVDRGMEVIKEYNYMSDI